MTITSQNAIKSGFFVISGRNSAEIEAEFHYYLKKQSQFAGGKMNVKSFIIMNYDDFAALRLGKSKANSKPILQSPNECKLNWDK